MAKMTSELVSHLRRCEDDTMLTGNEEGLATHDEDDLHSAKLLQAHAAAGPNRQRKLAAEDGAEDTDADNTHDVGEPLSSVLRICTLHRVVHQVCGVRTVYHHQVKPEADGNNGDTATQTQHEYSMLLRGGQADDPDLRQKCKLDEEEDQRRHDTISDGLPNGFVDAINVVVLHEEDDKIQKRSSQLDAHYYATDDVAKKCDGVEDEGGAPTLCRAGHKQQDQKQDQASTELRREDDSCLYSCHPDSVDVVRARGKGRLVRSGEVEGLMEEVLAREQHGCRHGGHVRCCGRVHVEGGVMADLSASKEEMVGGRWTCRGAVLRRLKKSRRLVVACCSEWYGMRSCSIDVVH